MLAGFDILQTRKQRHQEIESHKVTRDKGYQGLFDCSQEKPTGTRLGLRQGQGLRAGSAKGLQKRLEPGS